MFKKIFSLIVVASLSACGKIPQLTVQGKLSENSWSCPNNTKVTFSPDGIMSTTFGNGQQAQSAYKLVVSRSSAPDYLELADDKAVRPIFGGSSTLNKLEVSFSDLVLYIKENHNFQGICNSIEGSK